ncbi:hypothetical protein C5E10_11180 [Pseudoclavibacter sp. RFBG4]|uniref:hypothetical protein n=1 Tax=Pseudoclavibacter sp. RFBG4 TaxID=2080575 RepID=UPI000CE8DF4F|nr:hypothetical protein [Pseudoclavibacter sp. RFBG4]PPG31514.1 hypothetical protein C5E10_11180 [Pseudoclavibacter sp. RFBG4]
MKLARNRDHAESSFSPSFPSVADGVAEDIASVEAGSQQVWITYIERPSPLADKRNRWRTAI